MRDGAEPVTPVPAPRFVGAHVRRVEDPRLVQGRARYVDDLQLPGLLHLAFVRSPHPYARVAGIDAGSARAAPRREWPPCSWRRT